MPSPIANLRMRSMFGRRPNPDENFELPTTTINNGRQTFSLPGNLDFRMAPDNNDFHRADSMALYNSYKNRLNPDVSGPSNDVLDFQRYQANSRADRKVDADIALNKDKARNDEIRLDNEDRRIKIADRNSTDQANARDRRLDTVEQALRDKEIIQQGKDQTALESKLQSRKDVQSKAQEGLDLLSRMMDNNGQLQPDIQTSTGYSANVPFLDKMPFGVGTSASKGNADINQLKNILTIDLLNSLRNHSKTGSTGFGRMTDKDLKVIQDAASQLDYKNMTEDKYAEQLGFIRKKLHGIVDEKFDPEVGEIKTFPNGKKGKWDGKGWELVQ
jgi:hypothetical protein